MSEYSAAYARMRALKGKLLPSEDVETLLKLDRLDEAIIFIEGRMGLEIKEAIPLPQLEHKLKETLLVDISKIKKFLEGVPAQILACLISEFEGINLRTILRAKFTSLEIPEGFLFDLGPYSSFPLKELIKATTLEECFSILKDTPYKAPLALMLRDGRERREYLIDLTLDRDYYRRLHTYISDLPFSERQNAKGLLGTQIDVLNITRFLRLRFNYSLSPEEIFHYMLPHGLRFTESVFWRAAGSEDLLSTFPLNPYNKILLSCLQQEGDPVSKAEVLLNRYLFNFARIQIMKASPFEITPLLAFFLLKKFEIRDIIRILNSKKIGMKEDKIREYLITL